MSGLPCPVQLGTQVVHTGLKVVDGALENVSLGLQAVHRSHSHLPDVTEAYDDSKPDGKIAKSIEAVRAQIQRGLPVTADPIKAAKALEDIVGNKLGINEGVDDRKLGLEYLLTFLSHAPSKYTAGLEHVAIRTLYYDLPHPPSTHMGQDYQFRTADGSGNSLLNPTIGKAGTPYSRSCSGTRPLPVADLPDPGLVYDAIIRRPAGAGKFVPHPAGLSSLFFSYATSVIHSVFRTSRVDSNINETSSYVDLGILYGNTQGHQDKIRHVDGRGKILPDVFAETRVLRLPPAVTALLVVFNRNHNYIADMLLRINERGTWQKDTSKLSKEELIKQDHEIFNTARLINASTYANVVLGDFLSAILGTVRDGLSWTLDIASERRELNHTFLERGRGNSCSVEFNVIYRLHPSMSEYDATYAEKGFKYLFGEDLNVITPATFNKKLGNLQLNSTYDRLEPKPLKNERPDWDQLTKAQQDDFKNDGKPVDYLLKAYDFPRWERDPLTKKYRDDDLANALISATTVPAHAFGARSVPGAMRVIEIMGIEQARKWGCCSLNEFRRFMGLKPYATFEEWNPDKDVAAAARKLYRTTENLELYVGLVAEESKKVMDGAGLCPSYTMSRAILADAVALVRGDRYLTYDATPFNLTTWGFFDGTRNTANASWGGILGKLFARTLPRHFNATSVYTHFPLILPTGHTFSMDKILAKLGQDKEYTFMRPNSENEKTGAVKLISDPKAILEGLGKLEDSRGLSTLYGQKIKNVNLSPSYLTVIDDPAAFSRVTKLVQDIFVPSSELDNLGQWFYDKTIELIGEKSYDLFKGSPKYVDIVKDVLRLVPVHWGAVKIAGLPVKTTFEPRGIYYEQQMYQMLKEIYTYIYVQGEASLEIPKQREARENVIRLRRFIKLRLAEAKGTLPASVLGGIAGLVFGDHGPHTNPVLKRLLNLGSPINEAANDVLVVISTSSIELSQIFTHVINFYLAPHKPEDPNQLKAWDEQVDLQKKVIAVASAGSDPTSITTLENYVLEALRLDPVVEGVYRVATQDILVGPLTAKAKDRLYFDFVKAGKGPVKDYALYHGDGVFKTLGEATVTRVAAQVLRAVFSRSDIKRADGVAGTLRRYREPVVAKDDEVKYTEKDVTFQRIDEEGKLVDTKWKIPEKEYELIPADPKETADRWSYLDPETGHQPSTWATGLTLSHA